MSRGLRCRRRVATAWTAATLLCAAACAMGGGRTGAAEPPLVVLDPGHGPASPGAIGARGEREVELNDAFAALLAPRLVRAGFRVELTRAPGQELALGARAERAGALGAWLLLSIHHDSAQARYLEEAQRDGRPAFRSLRPIRGYSLFVSGLNPRLEESRRIAGALGRRLLALGRPPTLHHAEPIPGEGRPLLDERLGVYRFDALRVLRSAPCAAVLLELGVLVDEVDERYVTDPGRREAMADAVVAALQDARGP